MATTRQAGQKRWRARLAFGSFALSMTIAAGCAQTPTTAQQSADPLHGVRTPPGTVVPPNNPPPATTAIPPQLPPQAQNTGGVPVLPTSWASPNTATLAGATAQSSLGRPLAIDDKGSSPPPFFPASNSQQAPVQPGYVAPNPNPKVEPIPDSQPAAKSANVTPVSSWQAPQSTQPMVQTANAAPMADLAKQLKDRGVVNQSQDQTPEGLHLTCYVSRGASGGVRILEVTAADYNTAAQAILREIDAGR